MIGSNHYVPILKLKMGEVRALQNLDEPRKENLTPFFEINPIPWDYSEDKPAKTISEHLSKVVTNISSCWNKIFFLDTKYILEEISSGFDDIIRLHASAVKNGLSPIPVVGLGRNGDFWELAKAVNGLCGNGLCLRIEGEDFDSDDYSDKILDVLDMLGVDLENVDVLIDLGQIPRSGLAPFVSGLRSIIRFFPKVTAWRSLIISASSFPESMSDFSPDTASVTPRAEWDIWKRLVTGEHRLKRYPAFSDYAIATPAPFEMDPRMMRLGGKIKYTTDDGWLIVKGVGITRGGYKQFHRLAEYLTRREEYKGENYSWGDQYIYHCAKKDAGTGNQTTWVSVGMNHHFAVVSDQIAKFFDS